MLALKQEDIFKFSSGKDGPKVCILGGIHGNERGGVEAIQEIIQEGNFEIKKGDVTFILANRKAIDQNVRFVEENLNRCFFEEKKDDNTYEAKLALDIKEILKTCDLCLDLHASSVEGTEAFIICQENAYDYIKNFKIEKVCSGFDKLQPGGTDSYMNSIGKIGICVECGYLYGEETRELARDCIFTLLSELDMVDYSVKAFKKDFLEVKEIYYVKEEFQLVRSCQNFEFMEKGTLIGVDGDDDIRAPYDGFILFAHPRKKTDVDKDCFLFGVRKI